MRNIFPSSKHGPELVLSAQTVWLHNVPHSRPSLPGRIQSLTSARNSRLTREFAAMLADLAAESERVQPLCQFRWIAPEKQYTVNGKLSPPRCDKIYHHKDCNCIVCYKYDCSRWMGLAHTCRSCYFLCISAVWWISTCPWMRHCSENGGLLQIFSSHGDPIGIEKNLKKWHCRIRKGDLAPGVCAWGHKDVKWEPNGNHLSTSRKYQ